MATYILNVSLIWFVSLVFFELLLKRETFHGANRAYLLTTLLLAPVLPKIHWAQAAPAATYIRALVLPAGVPAPAHAPAAIASPYQPAAAAINWVLLLYLSAMAFSVILLLRNAYRLYRMAHRGRVQRLNGMAVIETGTDDPPCSFLRWIFIGNASRYEAGELEMILAHEQRHIQLGHSVDILLISLLQVALPFHPLLWWYRKRLQLVHEYQADAPARRYAFEYGHFLLEHQLLINPHAITHSLFHSPIKYRIVMLTKTASSKMSRAKYLLALPMTAALFLACNNYNVKPAPRAASSSKVIYRGNEFELSHPETKSIDIKDSTGKVRTSTFTITPYPVRMNGEVIFTPGAQDPHPAFKGAEGSVAGYVHKQLQTAFDKLGDGAYKLMLDYPVIDQTGKMVYYGGVHLFPDVPVTKADHVFENGVIDMTKLKNYPPEPEAQRGQLRVIERQMSGVLDQADLAFEPEVVNGKKVISNIDGSGWNERIVIKDHHSWVEPAAQELTVTFSIPEGH